ncbi:hypothetical protein K0M31_006946 [Melipona bicolor]|uniref:Uncharacterized protein n=1 Tax=Melipona bicolor TaxID=60889 RepID=A0AA40FS07_9HYME|nr:hypothetical protein K0M31_006946 [Melipona bicolor]
MVKVEQTVEETALSRAFSSSLLFFSLSTHEWLGRLAADQRTGNGRLFFLHRQPFVTVRRESLSRGEFVSTKRTRNRRESVINMQIRLDLMEHIPHVATISRDTPHELLIHDYVIRIINKYLKDQDNQVRMTAQTAILLLTKRGYFDKDTIETRFWPIIEFLCTSIDFSGVSMLVCRAIKHTSYRVCRRSPTKTKQLACDHYPTFVGIPQVPGWVPVES